MASAPFILRPIERRRLAWLVLAAAAALAATVAGTATRHALSAPPAPAVIQPVPPASAAIAETIRPVAPPMAAGVLAAPAAGTTGTVALPDAPVPYPAHADALAEPLGIVPARPFSFGRASAIDRGRALECLSAAIYYEAAGEPDDGQRAVAQVVLNRVRHPAFPATVCGVVYQGSERAGCQFSFACDGAMARPVSAAGLARATRIAAAALGGYVFQPIGLATHYHTYAVTPAWNRSLVMTAAIGAHFFHRWQGWWGTPAAFRQLYAGGEPVPGPHPSLPGALPLAPEPATATAPVAPAPVTPAAAITPAYRGASVARTPSAASGDALPPAPQVLDRWKDSGQPLR